MSKNGDMNTQKIPENSDEYNQIAHYLSMCANKTGVATNLEVWKIINAETAAKFDRRSGGMLRLPCWTDTNSLPEGDSVDSVCSYGFRFHGLPGFSFRSGVNSFGVDAEDGEESWSCQAFYCEVAVGRAHVTDEDPEVARPPLGFDSLYVSREKLDRNQDGEFSVSEYQAVANFEFRDAMNYSHDYFVRDPLLVNPKYLVSFSLSPHRQPPSPLVPTAVPEEVCEYFDPVQYRPVSAGEKQSNPQLARRLVTIAQAYQFAAEEAKKQDGMLTGKVDWIDEQLEAVEERVREVAVNYAEAHEQITAAMEQAVRRLQAVSREKMQLLLSMETELRREREEIEWAEKHIRQRLKASAGGGSGSKGKENRTGGGGGAGSVSQQLQFLSAWKSHAVLRNGLSRLRPVENEVLQRVLPDMQVHPAIEISSPTSLLLQQQQQQQYGDHASPVRRQPPAGGADSLTVSGSSLPASPPTGSREKPNKRASSPREESQQETAHAASFELSQFLRSAKETPLYGEAPSRPAEILVSSSTQALVDVNLAKIEAALTAALEEGTNSSGGGASNRRAMPLPISITRPTLSGSSFSLPGTALPPAPESTARRLKLCAQTGEEGGGDSWMGEENMQSELEREMRGLVVGGGEAARQTTGGHSEKRPSAVPPPRAAPMTQQQQAFSPVAGHRGLETMSAAASLSTRGGDGDRRGSGGSGGGALGAMEDSAVKIGLLMQRVAPFKPGYALTAGAQRRQKQMASSANFRVTEKSMFFGSTILEPLQAQELYFNVPFFSRPPDCRLLFSTERNARGLSHMLQACAEAGGGPVVLLLQSEAFKCGCYLSQAPAPTGSWAGSPACFLFSLTLDLKIPYHGRKPPGRGQTDFPCAFLADREHLEVGNGDLHLDGSLSTAYSELEGCYGVGLGAGSEEAMCLLGGSGSFAVDSLEVWLVASASPSSSSTT